MTEIEYKRGIEHNYLIFRGENATESYPTKMLMHNNIVGIVPLETRYMDATVNYYYEINSRQSLQKVFEQKEISFEQAKAVLCQIQNILQKTKEYLIEEQFFYFTPEFIYLNEDKFEVELIFYPEKKKESRTDFVELADFFLQHINHREEKAVYFAYQFYKITLQENFVIQDVLNLFYRKEEVEEERQESLEEIVVEKEKDNKNKKINIGFLVGGVFAIIGCVGIISFPNFYEVWIALLGVAAMGMTYVGICLWQRKRKKIQPIEDELEYDGNTVLLGYQDVREERILIGKIKAKETTYCLQKFPLTIGKSKTENTIAIEEEAISRKHAEILERAGKLYLKDLDSTNGTYKNGIRVAKEEEVCLEIGDEIEFANIRFLYR